MSQIKLSIRVSDLGLARTIAGVLGETVAPAPIAVTEFVSLADGYLVEAYYAASDGAVLAALVTQQADHPRDVADAIAAAVVVAVPDLNWVAVSQAALPPVAAGRFLVHGSHDRHRARFGSIEIDAGEAFGTAHHATTQGCLEAIDTLARARRPRRILDLGCGSGVLAIAAARVWPRATILASDIDPEAVRVAAHNMARNGVGRRVRPLLAAGLCHRQIRATQPFDLIIANILAAPLVRLAPGMARGLRRGGVAVISGLLVGQAAEVAAACRAQGLAIRERRDIAGWSVLTLVRRG